MRAYYLLAVVPALVFTGCTHVEREKVVEKPVPAKEVVVQQTAPRGCAYNSTSYSHGSMACQSNMQYRCEDGMWRSTNTGC
jgi:hypothetical protein